MSRPLRIQYSGATYHITVRGNEKKDIFFGDSDRQLFLRILGSIVKKNNWLCFAYCLMGNHFHLLIKTPDANLSEGMRQLNGVYTQKINEKYQRVGHLFQGRFKAFLIEDDVYFLTVARYVVLNPVRAGFVSDPSDYRWSSYRQTAGLTTRRRFLSIDAIYSRLSKNNDIAKIKYQKFVRDGFDGISPFLEAKHSILGSDRFLLELGNEIDTYHQTETAREQRIVGRPELQDIFSNFMNKNERDAAIDFAVRYCGYSHVAIARYISIHYSTVSKILKNSRFKT